MPIHIDIRGLQAIPHSSNGGLGAVETILNYYGQRVFEPEESDDLEKLSRESGFEFKEIPGQPEALISQLTSGNPVLVRYFDQKNLKYGVIGGYDGKGFRLLDTVTGSDEWMADDDFLAMWDNYAAVITPKSREFKKARNFREFVETASKATKIQE